MRRKTNAQSMVEMALILPFMLFIFFAIIDMGWYIYGYGTIYNAVRRGAEEASLLPPQKTKLANPTDYCAGAVFKAVQDNATMFPGIGTPAYVKIEYPPNNSGNRRIGDKIQVSVTNYKLYPLTPLLTLGKIFGLGGVDGSGKAVMNISTISERSIESLGQNPAFPNGIACQS